MGRLILGALMMAFLVPVAANAQTDVRRRGPAGARGEAPNLARALVTNRQALELSDEQATRLDELARQTDERRGQLRALRDQLGGGTELTDEQRASLRESLRAAADGERDMRRQIRSVLTMEQFDRAARLGAALGSLGGRNDGADGPRSARAERFGRGRQGFDRPGRPGDRRWAPRMQRMPDRRPAPGAPPARPGR